MAWRCRKCKKIMLPSKILSTGLCIHCTTEEEIAKMQSLPSKKASCSTNIAQTKLQSVSTQGFSSPAKQLSPVQLYDRLLLQEKMMIAQCYKIAIESAEIIDSTKDVDVFTQRYDTMLRNLSSIAALEPKVRFAGIPVHERIELLTAKRDSIAADMIIRQFNAACQKAVKLKTKKGRTNVMERFFAEMQATVEALPQLANTVGTLRTHLAKSGIAPFPTITEPSSGAMRLCDFAIVYYKNGQIEKCVPQMPGNLCDPINRCIYYTATNIVIDGVKVNLNLAESIAQIPAVSFYFGETTTNLAYQLKMRATQENDPAIAKVLIPKTAELMKESKIGWKHKDIQQLVKQLWALDLIEEGDALLQKYDCNGNTALDEITRLAKANFSETRKLCKELETDLVEMSFEGITCEECAKYEGRVFSISGSDSRFPPLPKAVFRYGGIHKGCRHSFGPYIFGSPLICNTEDPIAYSNRPFVDERTDEQKAEYEKFVDKVSHEDKLWKLTSEYYHKKHIDASSVPDTLREYLRTPKP